MGDDVQGGFGLSGGYLRRRWALVLITALFAASWALPPGAAKAQLGSQLVRFGESGSGAGQLGFGGPGGKAGGVEADPTNGHIFIAEPKNNRISEFTAWGEFVKAWGWGVRDGSAALQTCTAASGCRKGLPGEGPGQLNSPSGIAIDATGDLYVFEPRLGVNEPPNERVQVFTQAGEFVRMFGGGVDRTTGADVCTAADVTAGDDCGAGAIGTGPGEFSAGSGVTNSLMEGDYIAIAPDGTVYVADIGRIQYFEPGGTFLGELSFATIEASEPGFPASRPPGTLSVDPVSGDLYIGFRFRFADGPITLTTWRLSPTGAVVPPAPLISSGVGALPESLATIAVATDAHGDLVAAVDPIDRESSGGPSFLSKLLEFDPAGQPIGDCCGAAHPQEEEIAAVATNVVTAAGGVDVYAARNSFDSSKSFVEVIGPAPDKWPPPVVPPTIEAEYATSISEDSANVGADINPNFWADTRYFVEFGTEPCATGTCQTVPAPPGALLTSEIVKRSLAAEPIELGGLEPKTTYHYRFVTESGGGGPVVGSDATFTTSAPEAAVAACPNDPFRLGAAARLRDCRAYEMVSPVDKLGGDILVQGNISSFPARLEQAAPTGEAFTYSSYRSFGDAESARYTTQYLATRGAGGWSSHGISPPFTPPQFPNTDGLDSSFQGFSEDLSSGWMLQDYEPILAPGAIKGQPNLYRTGNLDGSYEALTTAPPIGTVTSPFFELNGFSTDGRRTVFTAKGKYTANASSNPNVTQVYESFKGAVRLVSVKPSGTAASVDSSAGSAGSSGSAEVGAGRAVNSEDAISMDGSRIYWSELEGNLYLRRNAVQTIQVSSGPAQFWTAKPDGSEAIYTEAGALKLFNLASQSSATLVADGVRGVMGASEDLSRIYLVSTAALAGAGQAGAPNLYLYELGAPLSYVATLSSADFLNAPAPQPVTLVPWKRVARVTPDGATAVFMSRATVTGADNVDARNGEPDAEVFRYSASSHQLRCISCYASGVRPAGAELHTKSGSTGYWYASKIPTWEFNLHASRVISDNGNRVFFDSLNALAPADRNEAEDIYEWEAPGTGTCSEGSGDFRAAAGGCVTLISSGEDERASEFVDASADGRDVFFLTGQSLVSWDPGQIDLYDAREGGGFPAPSGIPPECSGEACQPQTPAPPLTGNASQGFNGPGNPTRKRACPKGKVRRHGKCVRKRCPKGKVRRHGKCVRKHQTKHQRKHAKHHKIKNNKQKQGKEGGKRDHGAKHKGAKGADR